MSTEFWITYRFTSRVHVPPTTQLIEVESSDYKLTDLEDVLNHVFRQGFIEAKYRPVAWWEKKGGVPVKASTTLEFLLNEGVGKCPESSLQLVIEDAPTDLWFSYIYIHNPPAQVVAQRIKFASLLKRFEKVAHVTNYIFKHDFLPAKYRPHVFWEAPCGKRLSECASVDEILVAGEGTSEEKPLRLVIDDKHHHGCDSERPHWRHHHHEPLEHHHHESFEHHHHEPFKHHHHHEPFEHHHRHEPFEHHCHHEPLEHRHCHHEFHDHPRHGHRSCPSSPTVTNSPLKTASRFH